MARRRLGFWLRFAVCALKPPLIVLTRRDWRGMENVPKTGGAILVVNHTSHADPFTAAHYIYDSGRDPRFLAKSTLFPIPLIGRVLRGAGQIPVYRGTSDAVKSLSAAIEAVKAGEAVIIYPEGTLTRDRNLWPMRGKTGVARLWLATGAPVIPVAQWGSERIYHPITKRLRLWPKIPVTVVAGPPIDLEHWREVPQNTANLYGITEEIMFRLRDMVAEIRGETPPEELHQPGGGRPSGQAVADAD